MKLVIFDLDNTLYSGKFYPIWLVVNNLPFVLRTKAERTARHAVSSLDYGSGPEFRSALIAEISRIAGKPVSVISDWYSNRYVPSLSRTLAAHFNARPGARNLISSLVNRGIKVACLSDYPAAAERLAAIGLDPQLIPSWSTEEIGAPKPQPRAFQLVAQHFGVEPADVLVVGDRADTDAAGARAAGMDCILVKGKRSANDFGVPELDWDAICSHLSAR